MGYYERGAFLLAETGGRFANRGSPIGHCSIGPLYRLKRSKSSREGDPPKKPTHHQIKRVCTSSFCLFSGCCKGYGGEQFVESVPKLFAHTQFSHKTKLREFGLKFRRPANSESHSERIPRVTPRIPWNSESCSENGLSTPRAFVSKLGWFPGFWFASWKMDTKK